MQVSAQVLVEKRERAVPRELRRLLVVARRRVVVEAVLRALVDEELVLLVVRLERRFVARDSGADACVFGRIGVVQHRRRRYLRCGLGARRPRQKTLDRPVALRRLHGFDRRLDPRVVGLDLLRPGVVRLEAFVDRDGGHAADRELLDALHELAAADVAVLVLMEDVEEFLRIIGRLLALHADAPLLRLAILLQARGLHTITASTIYRRLLWPKNAVRAPPRRVKIHNSSSGKRTWRVRHVTPGASAPLLRRFSRIRS